MVCMSPAGQAGHVFKRQSGMGEGNKEIGLAAKARNRNMWDCILRKSGGRGRNILTIRGNFSA